MTVVKNSSEKFEKYIWYGVIAITAILFVAVITNFFVTRATSQATTNGYRAAAIESRESLVESTALDQALVLGTTASGDVAIEIKPKEIQNNQLKVQISMNTHSVDLGQFDLSQNMVLRYQNTVALPLSALQLQGHHTSGEVVFPLKGSVVTERIPEFTITITGIPQIQKRIFQWREE